eukprot:COSAG02_NODE_131_length_34710_cov_17.171159_21_plen_442_part_00
MQASGPGVYELQSVDAVDCSTSGTTTARRSSSAGSTSPFDGAIARHSRTRRSRSAGSERTPTGEQLPAALGLRLVQTRNGWRPTPLKDYRSAFEIQRQAKEDDALRWARVSERRPKTSSRGSRRGIKSRGTSVSPADFVKLPGRAAQSRALKKQLSLSHTDRARQAHTASSAFVLPPDASTSADDLVMLQKGDEVAVELEPGVVRTGRVRACFQARTPTISSEKPTIRSAEVLVRFEVGGGWFSRENVTFKSRPKQPLEPNLLQRVLQEDPQVKAQLASLQQRNGVSGTITDLVAGRSSRVLHRSASGALRKVKQGESVVSEHTKLMFQLLMSEDVEELQRMLDEGADITARNALGQSMCVTNDGVMHSQGKLYSHIEASNSKLKLVCIYVDAGTRLRQTTKSRNQSPGLTQWPRQHSVFCKTKATGFLQLCMTRSPQSSK